MTVSNIVPTKAADVTEFYQLVKYIEANITHYSAEDFVVSSISHS